MHDNWLVCGVVASVIWAAAAGNAGMHLAVAPAISAYRTCMESPIADAACRTNLHRDWADYSGDRLTYAAVLGLGPIPIGWLKVGSPSLAGAQPAQRYRGHWPLRADSSGRSLFLLKR